MVVKPGAVGTGDAPASSFGWLDLDAAASEKAATLLRAFDEPTTLDPLGLGSVRDLFSDLLAPGTSTIQTRLRYFLFIPWICQAIERDLLSPAAFGKRLNDDEAELINCLQLAVGPNQGVQGYESGSKLRRMPSEAYWGGLRSWGLRRLDLSIRQYGQVAHELGRSRPEVDDDGSPFAGSSRMWSALPDAPSAFLREAVDFELTEDEATALIEAIRANHPTSLLADACGFPALAAQAALPWDLPAARLSAGNLDVVRHARCLSDLTIGPQQIYNLLIGRRAATELHWDTESFVADVLALLGEWVELVEHRRAELDAWVRDMDSFWAFIDRHGGVPKPVRDFVTTMLTRAMADPSAFVEDPSIHDQIRLREIDIKGSRARLGPLGPLENWKRSALGGRLVYRWPTAVSYLNDLGQALGSS